MAKTIQRRGVRVAYVGPNMDLAMAAYLPHHRNVGHEVEYYVTPDHLPVSPPQDVVVIAPLASRNGRIEGPCLVSSLVPPTTLIVALATVEGPAHAMFVKHAFGGRCHNRILVHYPRPGFRGSDFVGKLDAAIRRPGPVAEAMCGVPESLDLTHATVDLGQILDDPTLTDFLYVAATDRHWSTWNELAVKLHLSEGTVKNRMTKFGQTATEAGLIPANTDRKHKFRAGEFVRYVTEHRSFIQAYAQHHEDGIGVTGGPAGPGTAAA